MTGTNHPHMNGEMGKSHQSLGSRSANQLGVMAIGKGAPMSGAHRATGNFIAFCINDNHAPVAGLFRDFANNAFAVLVVLQALYDLRFDCPIFEFNEDCILPCGPYFQCERTAGIVERRPELGWAGRARRARWKSCRLYWPVSQCRKQSSRRVYLPSPLIENVQRVVQCQGSRRPRGRRLWLRRVPTGILQAPKQPARSTDVTTF